jgi:hypothetical protein
MFILLVGHCCKKGIHNRKSFNKICLLARLSRVVTFILMDSNSNVFIISKQQNIHLYMYSILERKWKYKRKYNDIIKQIEYSNINIPEALKSLYHPPDLYRQWIKLMMIIVQQKSSQEEISYGTYQNLT